MCRWSEGEAGGPERGDRRGASYLLAREDSHESYDLSVDGPMPRGRSRVPAVPVILAVRAISGHGRIAHDEAVISAHAYLGRNAHPASVRA
jgi:hypothetical protein